MYPDALSMKEQFIHFTLNDFSMIIDKYGVDEIIRQMDEDTYWKLYKWFTEGWDD